MRRAIVALTFEKLLLAVFLIQVDDDRPGGLLSLPLAPGHETLLEGQQAVHLVPHQQHASVTTPVLHHLRPGNSGSYRTRREYKLQTETFLLSAVNVHITYWHLVIA